MLALNTSPFVLDSYSSPQDFVLSLNTIDGENAGFAEAKTCPSDLTSQ
jgi:hypothetical protein